MRKTCLLSSSCLFTDRLTAACPEEQESTGILSNAPLCLIMQDLRLYVPQLRTGIQILASNLLPNVLRYLETNICQTAIIIFPPQPASSPFGLCQRLGAVPSLSTICHHFRVWPRPKELGLYLALSACCVSEECLPPWLGVGAGLVAIKDAHDIETRLNEVEKLLKTIISMPCKYSRSEVVLTFFERSPLDQVLKNDNVHKIQPSFQSPVKISEIMRSNGFCLANTETIVIDHSIPNGKDQHLGVDPTEHLFENGSEFTSELEDGDDPAAYVTNLSYYHLVPFETDILD
ncbi:PX domain-containing protein 1 [Puma concolor]|uniref:PX domain-containing protein 1 n=1 Tax=Puma concolor TaxID=9696 RepID=A0A6P6HBQ8_PUMCO|nr:PX domain-containing protein 1 [Puma concolor]